MGFGHSDERSQGRPRRAAWLMHLLQVLVLAVASLALSRVATHAPQASRSVVVDGARAQNRGKVGTRPFGLHRSQRSSHRLDERARAIVDVEGVEVDVSEDGNGDELRHLRGVPHDAASRVDAWRRHRLLCAKQVELQNDPSQLGFARPFPRGPPALRG